MKELKNYLLCKNCRCCSVVNYASGNEICSGIVKHTDPILPFDIIRLCVTTSNNRLVNDYTPDEAISVSGVLTASIGNWLCNSKAYKKFRNQKKKNKKR